jgi:hypothetical protein
VLVDEQAGGAIVELLADVLAELDADFVAARAETLGLAQRVFDADAWQIRRQLPAAAAVALTLGRRSAGIVGRRRWSVRGCFTHGSGRQLRQQPRLLGMESFRFRTIELA